MKKCNRCGKYIGNQYKDNYIKHWSKQSQKVMFFSLCDSCRLVIKDRLKQTGVI